MLQNQNFVQEAIPDFFAVSALRPIEAEGSRPSAEDDSGASEAALLALESVSGLGWMKFGWGNYIALEQM